MLSREAHAIQLTFCLREGGAARSFAERRGTLGRFTCGGTRNNGLGPRRHWDPPHRRMICLLAGVPRASFRGRSARKGMSMPSHLRFRRTGSDCALAIQSVAALLTELFPREVVIKECRRTAGASVAIFQGFCLGFGQLTRRIIHVESPRYSPRTSVDLSGDHAWLDTTKVLTISSPAKSLEQFVCLVRTRTAFRGLPEIT